MNKRISLLFFAVLLALFLRLPASAQNYVFQSTITERLITNPAAIAADNAGNLWVAGNNRVIKYDVNRNVALTLGAGFNGSPAAIGGAGSSNGEFKNPSALATDRKGNVFVADLGNARVQEFDTNGNYLRSLTTGPAFQPVQLAVDSAGVVYILDAATRAVVKYTASGAPAGYFANPNSAVGFFSIDSKDNVYVFSYDALYIYNTLGRRLKNVSLSALPAFKALALAPDNKGNLYVVTTTDPYAISGGIIELDPSGALLMSQSYPYISSLAADGNGAIYGVYPKAQSDNFSAAIKRIDSGSTPGLGVTLTDTSPSAVNLPYSPVVDAQGNIYFLSGLYLNQHYDAHIRKVDRAGRSLGYFAEGQVQAPGKLQIDSAGHIVVFDSGSRKTFDLSGRLIASVPVVNNAEVFDRNGNYYTAHVGVTSPYYHGPITFTLYINEYDPSGQLIKQYPASILGSYDWNGRYPEPILAEINAVDSHGNLFVNIFTPSKSQIWKLNGNGALLTTIDSSVAILLDQYDHLYTYHENGEAVIGPDGRGSLAYDSVRILDDSGNLLSQFGSAGGVPGLLDFDNGMFLDDRGNLFIANAAFNRIDIFAPSTNVVGTAALDGVSLQALAALPSVTVQFRTPGTTSPLFTRTVTLTPDSPVAGKGAFTVPNVPPGTYDLAFKTTNSLQTTIHNVPVSGIGYGPDVFLRGGDASNDNAVDPTDFGILVEAYGSASSVPGSGYDPAADFNFDGMVDALDFGILVGNYNTVGDL